MNDTIFAVSSGAPPAAIAVLRISGAGALTAAAALAGTLPAARRAGVRRLVDRASGETLDTALVLVFPGPASATGEDLVELHLHGGRAVVRGVEAALGLLPGLRAAEPGEFTRRALANGRIDLAQAEGLADLLAAETEAQRRVALAAAEGAVSRAAGGWIAELIALSARAEALIDFADEDDVAADDGAVAALTDAVGELAARIAMALAQPPVERLHDGVRVVLAGPPNSGKSTLFNALIGRDAAIVSPIAGTTRDRIEAPVVREGVAYVLVDTAGLREATEDAIEAIGIVRAREAVASGDIVVWLGDDAGSAGAIPINARCDLPERAASTRLSVSARSGAGLDELWHALATRAAAILPSDLIAFNRRQHALLAAAVDHLGFETGGDLLKTAEHLRLARLALAAITGASGIEKVLDDLFGRFCIGK